MAPIRPIRGIFGRFEGIQAWGPGTHSTLRQFGRSWLEMHFPEVCGKGRTPSRLGAVWVKFVDGQWCICHVSVPEWSSDRTIPAWALVVIPHEEMSGVPCLAAAIDDVTNAVRSPTAWASAVSTYEQSAAWGARALAVVAALFDASIAPHRSGELPGIRLGAGFLDTSGWLALQALLVAMRDSGMPSPCAVRVLEQSWDGGSKELVANEAFVLLDPPSGTALLPNDDALCLRGADIQNFTPDFVAAHRLLVLLAHEFREDDTSSGFVELASRLVPLELIDPARIEPFEVRDWAASVARVSGDPRGVATRLDGLAERVAQGERGLLPHLLALAAVWAEVAGLEGFSVDSRLESWVGRAVRVS